MKDLYNSLPDCYCTAITCYKTDPNLTIRAFQAAVQEAWTRKARQTKEDAAAGNRPRAAAAGAPAPRDKSASPPRKKFVSPPRGNSKKQGTRQQQHKIPVNQPPPEYVCTLCAGLGHWLVKCPLLPRAVSLLGPIIPTSDAIAQSLGLARAAAAAAAKDDSLFEFLPAVATSLRLAPPSGGQRGRQQPSASAVAACRSPPQIRMSVNEQRTELRESAALQAALKRVNGLFKSESVSRSDSVSDCEALSDCESASVSVSRSASAVSESVSRSDSVPDCESESVVSDSESVAFEYEYESVASVSESVSESESVSRSDSVSDCESLSDCESASVSVSQSESAMSESEFVSRSDSVPDCESLSDCGSESVSESVSYPASPAESFCTTADAATFRVSVLPTDPFYQLAAQSAFLFPRLPRDMCFGELPIEGNPDDCVSPPCSVNSPSEGEVDRHNEKNNLLDTVTDTVSSIPPSHALDTPYTDSESDSEFDSVSRPVSLPDVSVDGLSGSESESTTNFEKFQRLLFASKRRISQRRISDSGSPTIPADSSTFEASPLPRDMPCDVLPSVVAHVSPLYSPTPPLYSPDGAANPDCPTVASVDGVAYNGSLALSDLPANGPRQVRIFTDPDRRACKNRRRSVGGDLGTVDSTSVSWQFKRQAAMAMYTCESGYMGMGDGANGGALLFLPDYLAVT
jgi:hypothetical protein